MRLKLALTLVLLAACKKTEGPTTNPDEPTSSDGADEADAATADPNAPPTCEAGGRVWDGHHEGCLYEVGGCCYDGPEEACAAAGCKDDCQILESSPAAIACPKG